jgi:diguanylate cyclase (GGDEF)-like protein
MRRGEVTTTIAMSFAVGVLGVLAARPGGHGLATWILLGATFLVSERLTTDIEVGRHAFTLNASHVITVFGLLVLPSGDVVLAAIAATAVAAVLDRQSPPQAAVNLGLAGTQVSVIAAVGAALSPVGLVPGEFAALAAITVGVLVSELLSAVVIAVATRLSGGRLGALRPLVVFVTIAAVGSSALGAIGAEVYRHHAWMIVLVAAITGGLAVGLRAYAGLSQRFRNVRTLYEFTQAMARSTDAGRAVVTALQDTNRALNAGWAELALREDDGTTSRWTMASDGADRADGGNAPSGVAAAILDGGEGSIVAGDDDAVAVPLVVGGRTTGAIVAHDRLGNVATFGRDDLSMLEAIAAHTAATVETRRLIERLNREAAERDHQARHDALTGLPNRREFANRLQRRLDAGEHPAVATFDVRRLRDVNDMFGFEVGDELLRATAQRLQLLCADAELVARTGSDEFAVAVPTTVGSDPIEAVAAVQEAFRTPFRLAGVDLVVPLRAGVALPPYGDDALVVTRHAEQAVAIAQEQRLDDPVVFDDDEDARTARRLALAVDLRTALETGALELWYQPKIALVDGEPLVGAEALTRWRHPSLGFVPPMEFIGIAEQVGLIGPLTRWVIDTAAEQANRWRHVHGNLAVAVNASAHDLRSPDMVTAIAASVRRYGLADGQLTLEITETQIMDDPAQVVPVLVELDRLGVRLSIDDFGTGYSSLAYLKRLPVHELKIDRSFVIDLLVGRHDAAIARMIIDLGRSLGLKIVAEGVEDAATAQALRDMGCDIAQGYHFARPLPAADFDAWVVRYRHRTSAA